MAPPREDKNRLSRLVTISVVGLFFSLLTPVLLHLLGRWFRLDPFNLNLIILPVGAVLSGLFAVLGYWVASFHFAQVPTRALGVQMVLAALATFALIKWSPLAVSSAETSIPALIMTGLQLLCFLWVFRSTYKALRELPACERCQRLFQRVTKYPPKYFETTEKYKMFIKRLGLAAPFSHTYYKILSEPHGRYTPGNRGNEWQLEYERHECPGCNAPYIIETLSSFDFDDPKVDWYKRGERIMTQQTPWPRPLLTEDPPLGFPGLWESPQARVALVPISRPVLVVWWALCAAVLLRVVDVSRLGNLFELLPLGRAGALWAALGMSLLLAAMLYSLLAEGASEWWLWGGMLLGFFTVLPFIAALVVDGETLKNFKTGLILAPIGLVLLLNFSRDRGGMLALHLVAGLLVLGAGTLFILALLFQTDWDLWGRILNGGLAFILLSPAGVVCFIGGLMLGERLLRFEPAYKAVWVGTVGGALAALLVQCARVVWS